ncbi:hypothetical protein F2P81_015170 [Scophthalmus maximus]|uniref:Uncharacterized protein n=1 Tax=Scophthalmus maximus TaxID=52904 RepID=A0A6A4SLW4_SCOMX|nr:hypothetical protein F2P81_015170 [Scophthalmus maximus]
MELGSGARCKYITFSKIKKNTRLSVVIKIPDTDSDSVLHNAELFFQNISSPNWPDTQSQWGNTDQASTCTALKAATLQINTNRKKSKLLMIWFTRSCCTEDVMMQLYITFALENGYFLTSFTNSSNGLWVKRESRTLQAERPPPPQLLSGNTLSQASTQESEFNDTTFEGHRHRSDSVAWHEEYKAVDDASITFCHGMYIKYDNEHGEMEASVRTQHR